MGARKPLVRELKAVVMQEDGDSGTKVAALYEATQEREILPGEIRTLSGRPKQKTSSRDHSPMDSPFTDTCM